MRAPRLLLAASLACAIVALAALPAHAFSAGRADRAAAGCGGPGCHGGLPSTVAVALEGLPDAYTPGDTYLINVTVTGARAPLPAPLGQHAGGFALGATDGALSALPGSEDVQIDATTGNATHTTAGSVARAWTVVWTAPPATAGVVTFTLSANAVNGNAAPDPLDEWATATFTTKEGPENEGPPAPSPVETQGPPSTGSGVPAPALAGVLVALALAGAVLARRRA